MNDFDYLYWFDLGIALGKSGAHQESLEAFCKALDICPDSWTALYNKGIALYELGKYQEALESYQKVLLLEPNDPDVWQRYGLVAEKLGIESNFFQINEKLTLTVGATASFGIAELLYQQQEGKK